MANYRLGTPTLAQSITSGTSTFTGTIYADNGIDTTNSTTLLIGTTNASAINISRDGILTSIDGYLKIDGYGCLSHDVGNTNILRLTQPANTTTGSDLRLRALRFFDDGAPTSAIAHKIYAPDGNSVGVSATRWQFLVTDIDSASQDITWSTGGNHLEIVNLESSLKITPDTGGGDNAGIDGYCIAIGGDATTRHGMRMALHANTDGYSSGITLNTLRVTATDNTSIDGYLIGMNIDVSGGSNTAKQRSIFKKKAHAAFDGSDSLETTSAIQTTSNTQTTMWSCTLSDNTLYWFEASVIGRDIAGIERAMYGKKVLVYREGGVATIQGSVQDIHTDVETSAGLDATFTVNSNDLRLSVTGLSSTTINWTATITYQAVSGNT